MRTPMSCCFLRFFGSGQQDCVRAWVVGCGRQGAGGVLHRGRFGEGGTDFGEYRDERPHWRAGAGYAPSQ